MIREAQRVANWNSVRYNQEFDLNLTTRILAEELGELAAAKTDVDQVDALLDLMYISFGALWKMGLTSEQIQRMFNIVADANDTKVVPNTPRPKDVKANTDKGADFVGPEERLQDVLDERVAFKDLNWDDGIPT